MRAAPLVALLLLLTLPTPHASSQSPTPTGDPWVITDSQVCKGGRLVVDRNITIESGGVLALQGCTLAMKSFPYNDVLFAQRDEGLLIDVKPGGILLLQALPGQPAAIEREDLRYGYTVRASGTFISAGLPGTMNRIAGLEGAHEGNLVFGGLRVRDSQITWDPLESTCRHASLSIL